VVIVVLLFELDLFLEIFVGETFTQPVELLDRAVSRHELKLSRLVPPGLSPSVDGFALSSTSSWRRSFSSGGSSPVNVLGTVTGNLKSRGNFFA
jgi:hypothetical protein